MRRWSITRSHFCQRVFAICIACVVVRGVGGCYVFSYLCLPNFVMALWSTRAFCSPVVFDSFWTEDKPGLTRPSCQAMWKLLLLRWARYALKSWNVLNLVLVRSIAIVKWSHWRSFYGLHISASLLIFQICLVVSAKDRGGLRTKKQRTRDKPVLTQSSFCPKFWD